MWATTFASPVENWTFEPLAGTSSTSGSVDGARAAARFAQPAGLAADAAGNLYIADTSNSTIRKISPAGVVSTLAGTPGASGFEDGTGYAARFSQPTHCTVDRAGNLLVVDYGNRAIRKISPTGVVSTIAAPAMPVSAAPPGAPSVDFVRPTGVAVDGAGNVFVSDSEQNDPHYPVIGDVIWKITPAGAASVLAGERGVRGSTDGTGVAAHFNQPEDLAIDANGDLIVSDSSNFTIRRVTPAGVVTTIAGTAGKYGYVDAIGAAARFSGIQGVAIAPDGMVYGYGNDRLIRTISPAAYVSTLAVHPYSQVGSVQAVAVDAGGTIYVAVDDCIRKISPGGEISDWAGILSPLGEGDGFAAEALLNASAIAVDAANNLYITGDTTIRRVTPAGLVTTWVGATGLAGHVDGAGSAARFNAPAGLAFDHAGNLFVADAQDHTIRKVAPDRTVTTVAGLAGYSGSVDGAGAEARFASPIALAIDSADNLYVADSWNVTIRKITPSGVVTTLAGMPGKMGSEDGVGAAARFMPFLEGGLTVDHAGNLYVTDAVGLRKITPAGEVSTLFGREYAIGTGPAMDEQDNIYFAGRAGIFKFTPDRQLNVIGSLGGSGLVINRTGQLIVSDYGRLYVGRRDAAPSRLVNLSCRARTGAGADTLIVGFVVEGSGQALLARAIGPSLVAQQVPDALPAARLTLFAGSSSLATNEGWSDGPDADAISATATRVGAFALARGTRDAGVLTTLEGGVYTLHATGAAPGTVLAEIYDAADAATSSARLVNISARMALASGADVGIAGFVVSGDRSKTVLVRAIGPTLAHHGVEHPVARPRLRVFSGGDVIAENSGWNSGRYAATLPGVFTRVGASALETASNDAVLLLTLRPGVYTAHATSADGTPGIVLVDIYEVE